MGRRVAIDIKKRKIVKDPKLALSEALLEISEIESSPVPREMLEWTIAFAEYFNEHPGEWEEVEQADPPRFKDLKEKAGNFFELFRKVRPPT